VKSPKVIAGMIGVFVVSFMFFLYLSFPYGVLKEAISTGIETATGITVRMESFGPGFPLGLSAEGVEIYKGSSPRVKLESASVKVSLLQMFMFRLGAGIQLRDQKGGNVDVGLGYGIGSVLTGSVGLPSYLSITAKSFIVDSFAALAIYLTVDSGAAGASVGPLLGKLGVKGKISAAVDMNLDNVNPAQSSGSAKINLSDAVLVLSDPSLNFPDQSFKTATVSASAAGGALTIDPSTRFTTSDLELGADGKITLKPIFSASVLGLNAFLHLKGALGEQYGMLVDAMSGGLSKEGSINVQVSGTMAAPQFNPI
jgi:type II secretion system protein N